MTAGRTNTKQRSQHWCTPPKYVRVAQEVLGQIELDPCSNRFSTVGALTKWQPPVDGLSREWDFATIYVNPPYGADRKCGTTIKNWLGKCAEAHRTYGSHVLALVPVAPNTSHWKLYVWGVASRVAFLYDTRLKFFEGGKEHDKGAPMACAMVYWGSWTSLFEDALAPHAAVVRQCR